MNRCSQEKKAAPSRSGVSGTCSRISGVARWDLRRTMRRRWIPLHRTSSHSRVRSWRISRWGREPGLFLMRSGANAESRHLCTPGQHPTSSITLFTSSKSTSSVTGRVLIDVCSRFIPRPISLGRCRSCPTRLEHPPPTRECMCSVIDAPAVLPLISGTGLVFHGVVWPIRVWRRRVSRSHFPEDSAP